MAWTTAIVPEIRQMICGARVKIVYKTGLVLWYQISGDGVWPSGVVGDADRIEELIIRFGAGVGCGAFCGKWVFVGGERGGEPAQAPRPRRRS